LVLTPDKLLVSVDGGKTWNDRYPKNFRSQYLTIQTISPLNAKTCWLVASYVGKDARCFKTEDGGNSWTERARFFPERDNILSVNFSFSDNLNGSFVFSAGRYDRYQSTLCKTVDGGERWSNLTLKTTGIVHGMAYIDSSRIWMVEVKFDKRRAKYFTSIHYSKDGGLRWSLVTNLREGIRDFYLLPDKRLFLCGQNGLIASLTAEDQPYETHKTHTRMTIESISFCGNIGIAAGNGGLIRSKRSVLFLLSRDTGRTWKRLESPIQASIESIHLTAWDRGLLATAEAITRFQIRS
jgi:photosystem II stability/assembly factor-like uncharacterized protein